MSESDTLEAEERIRRNMAFANEFLLAIIDDPSMLDAIPEDAYVFFVPEDDPAFAAASRRGADRVRRQGHPVYIRQIGRTKATTLTPPSNGATVPDEPE